MTLEWALFYSAYYPDIQKKVQNEIDTIIGNERVSTYADRLLMPYTLAFICEVYRARTVMPMNLYRRLIQLFCNYHFNLFTIVLHRTVKDTHIRNHYLPKDTLVLANFWAAHNDPKLWDNPHEFHPLRFLTSDGKQLVNTENVVPFSSGAEQQLSCVSTKIELTVYY